MSFADSPFASAPFAATGENNAVVTLSGLQLNIAENNLTVSAGGSVVTGSEENTIETFLGTVIAESESIVEVTGVSARFNDLARFSYSLDSETAGFPVLSNTQSKTGTTSAYFGSTSNEIQIPQEQDVIQSALSANNQFTIEFWYYEETETEFPRLISVQQTSSASTRQFGINRLSNNNIEVVNQDGRLIRSSFGSVSIQNWHHIAVTADNGTLELYIDGVLDGTSTGTTFIDAQSEFNIGGTGPYLSTDDRYHLDGYMDLFRVSNSVRYTTNFTPPTSAFTVDDNTTIIFNFDGPNGSQDFELLQLPYSSTDIVADANVDVTGVSATISLPNITDGLTLSNTYQSLTNLGSITGRNQNIVFQTDSNGILLKSSYTDAEIWWEAGGTTVGAWLGIAKINNAYFIRFRTGSGLTNEQTTGGGTAGTLNSRAVVNLSVSDSSVASYFDDERHIITWAIEIPDATYLAGRLRLWIDGNEVITYDPYNDDGNVLRIGGGSAQWAGGDSAGYGQGFSQIAGGDGTFDSGATQYQTFTGTSVGSDVYVFAYENQTISQLPIVVIGNADVDVTGEVLSTELGTEVVTASALVQPTGLEISFAEGDAIVTADSNIEVTGLSSEFATGTVVAPAAVILTGVSMQFAEGTETIVADANVDVTGLEINFTEGTETIVADANVDVTGLEINFAEGTATVVVDAIIDVTGLEISSQSGNVEIVADANVSVTGQVLNFALGKETITGAWGPVDPDANNSYNGVAPGASNSWTEVAA
jgi:hypothetical protein